MNSALPLFKAIIINMDGKKIVHKLSNTSYVVFYTEINIPDSASPAIVVDQPQQEYSERNGVKASEVLTVLILINYIKLSDLISDSSEVVRMGLFNLFGPYQYLMHLYGDRVHQLLLWYRNHVC